MSIAEHMLNQRIEELERQINHIKSVTLNVMAEIRIAADEEDYDEIIAICEQFEPAPEKKPQPFVGVNHPGDLP